MKALLTESVGTQIGDHLTALRQRLSTALAVSKAVPATFFLPVHAGIIGPKSDNIDPSHQPFFLPPSSDSLVGCTACAVATG